MKRPTWLIAGFLACVVGCGRQQPVPQKKLPVKPPKEPAVAKTQELPPELQYKDVEAKVGPYTVSPTLKAVANSKRFQGTAEQKALLAKNLFAVTPTDAEQLFHVYENNDYGNIPSFVTIDLVLQLYHIFYDFTLRKVETEKLIPLCEELTKGMLTQSVATWKSVRNKELKEAALHNVAFFGVAARQLELEVALPKQAASLVDKDCKLIEKHKGFGLGGVFPYKIDFSQFVPRGHYTRTDALKRYFKAMMWYGLTPFSFKKQIKLEGTVRSDLTVRMGLLFVRDLYEAELEGKWDRIYEPTVFYVGAADDLRPDEYRALADEVFGADAPAAAFADRGKFDTFVERGLKLREPKIKPKVLHIVGDLLPFPDPQTQQVRFMGQRHIPDSEVLQRLSEPMARFFPAGMDVMAVLGSKRAEWLLDEGYPELFDTKAWPDYGPERGKLVEEFASLDDADWVSNMYWGWLWTLQAAATPVSEGYPSVMLSDAWNDKALSTALASWAELRHDTILYAKQSVAVAECGGGDEEPPPMPKGYVEPNVEVYRRLQVLTHLSKDGLQKRDLLDDELIQKFGDLEDLLAFLRRVSEKQLKNEPLAREEYEEIKIIGALVERLSLSVIEGTASEWQEIVSPTDRNMAVIADVHTGGTTVEGIQALEEGVGHANEILAIVPVEGKLQLTRGAVFSYYEFLHPYEDRLTDEKWQKMLKSEDPPKPPPWTESFLAPKPKGDASPMKVEVYSSGC